jgi:hypothetical protein
MVEWLLASRKCLDIVNGQSIATNAPVAALDLFDNHPRYWPQVLAFDRYHRIGQLADYLLLLLGREHAFDYFDIY